MTRSYRPPIDDILSAMRTSGDIVADDVTVAVTELGRFAHRVLAPTDAIGDRDGVSFDADSAVVTIPSAIVSAYRSYVDAGWPVASVDERHGGGGLTYVARLAIEEILASSSLALSLAPMLTHGAIELLGTWGSESQKESYLPRLVSGEWTATMNLTEPDAGSDVGALRTGAVPVGDGMWRITGTKIFITWGEHDLTENIVHMVLARTPGAATGTRGISLFLVPKILGDGRRNTVWCRGVERKLGIHGSPTCTLEFDGALGELVGPEFGGMAAMFTMMNTARLAVAIQGVAIGQLCFEQASDYARTRRQGAVAGCAERPARIIEHPDVRRMELDLRSTTRAMRLGVLRAGAHLDASRRAGADEDKERRAAALLTPVLKAWCTDQGVRLASVALQILGGPGYIEESGIAQRLRDSRIGPIYEGTNGIQAVDLVSRRVRSDSGVAMGELLDELESWADQSDELAAPSRWAGLLSVAIDLCRYTTEWICRPSTSTADILAGAAAYLDLVGTTVGGALVGQHARLAAARGEPVHELVVDAEFFATEHLARAQMLVTTVTAGAGRLDLPGI